MKKFSTSSKKKKTLFADERSGEETVTPRVKKSYSVTNAHYLQLQLDTSSKKRESMEKSLQAKDKRIKELQKQVKQQQDYINTHLTKHKQMRYLYQQEKNQKQRIQKQLRDSVALCRAMNDKCKELLQRNQNLEKGAALDREKLAFEEKKMKQLKLTSKKDKDELRTLYKALLQALEEVYEAKLEQVRKAM